MRSFLPSAILASLGVAAAAAAPLDFSPADTYIASENMIVLRMVRSNGSVREFERVMRNVLPEEKIHYEGRANA